MPTSTPALAEEGQRRGRQRHRRQPGGVGHGADDEHAERAEAVGHHAGEQAGHAPGEVLHRDREARRSRATSRAPS